MTALSSRSGSLPEKQDAFLNVARSARGFRWVERLEASNAGIATAISQKHELPQLLARVLAARGVTPETVKDFLEPTLKQLMPDPSLLQDMDTGAARFARAIVETQKVTIFGDYDVDGASSAALVARFARAHGLEPQIYIPDRMTEGYGPNTDAFESIIAGGAQLIITVDCGTAAYEPIDHAKSRGADVIVVDHHLASEQLPGSLALINPNRLDDISGQGDLAAAGVTFLFLVAVARQLREAGWYSGRSSECDLREWLDLVALATVCDVVPLTGLNRAFVTQGLKVMRQRRNPGLRALADAAGLATEPTSYHLGFVFGPRINAGGRIGDSLLGAHLLTTDDDLKAAEIAATLDRLNTERKSLETTICEEAFSQAEFLLDAQSDLAVIVAHGEAWHRGVVGLVASRLAERFSRPAIAIAWDRDDTGAGSARSVAGVDIGSVVNAACAEGLLIKGGGHAMAAGLTVARSRLDPLVEFLETKIRLVTNDASQVRELKIDGALMPSGVNAEIISMLERAGPYGSGNPQPRFVLAAHRCNFAKVVGDNHVRCSLSAGDGSRMGAIAFRAADTALGALLLEADGMPLHIAGHLRRDQWGGRDKIELLIEDAANPRAL